MKLYSIIPVIILSFLHGFQLNAQVTPHEAISQMTRGINLGNTHEPPYEAGWGNPKAEEYYFDMYKDAGFNTIRIPVRWDGYTDHSSPYEIDEYWLNRIEEVVDWGLSRDLWIIINTHHEAWIKENYDRADYRARFDSIWSQIAIHFKDKSEKLIFEILNEPHGMTKADCDDLHARAISIIRKTNPTRLIIFQGNNWGGSSDLINAAIPNDDYLIGSFHSYDPWPFGLEGTGSFGSDSDIQKLRDMFTSVNNWSVKNNIPVFLGEFGCHKDAAYMSRVRHMQTYVELSQEFGFCSCAWDDGGNFRIMQRLEKDWNYLKDILIYGHFNSPGYPRASIFNDTIIKIQWTNRVNDNDHIIIQRGLSTDKLVNYDTIPAESTEYHDIKPAENKTWYYRIITEYTDSLAYYSYAARAYMPTYIPPEFVIDVVVNDETNGGNLQLANVTFNGISISTDNEGQARFDEYAGNYDLSINKEYYSSISETIEISSDTTLYFTLSATHGNIKIWVKEDGKPLSDVSVIIGDSELLSNGLGIVNFEDIPLNTQYDYLLSKDGFIDMQGSLYLIKDTTFTLDMMPVSVENKTEQGLLNSWPNPATTFLTIHLPDLDGTMSITNVTGKTIKEITVVGLIEKTIDISNFKNGLYFLIFRSNEQIFINKFIKTPI